MLKLYVQSSTTIKHKKPFSKFTWLKEEADYGLYALQGSKPNYLTVSSGKVKKVEILKQLWSHLVNINYSLNGHYCAGVLDDGDVMIWHVSVKLPPQKISSPLSGGELQSKGTEICGIKIFVSNSSNNILLVSAFNEFYLSKIENDQNYTWWKIAVGCFPTLSDADKTEATVDAQFHHDLVIGDCLSCAVVYSPSIASDTITIHHFTIKSLKEPLSTDHVQHKIVSYSSEALCGCSNAPRGRGALVMRHSPNGRLIALAINYHKKSHSRVLFLSPQCNVMTSISPYGEKKDYGRGWWITDMAWTADGLLLVCIIKRGSLLILPCMGRPLQLVTCGCSLDMGPSILLPLHPRISYIPAAAVSSKNNESADNEVSLSSERDSYKQKFSVATHPILPLILCSDGYLLTVMKLEETYNLASLVTSLVKVSKARLSQYNHVQGNTESITKGRKRRKSLSSISLHDNHPNIFSDISNLPDVTQTAQSRLHSTSKYSVRFEGIDSIHETSSLYGDDDPLHQIFSQTITAFCLLLNSEVLLPHSGMLPYSGVIDSATMNSIRNDVITAGDVVITTLLGIDDPLDCNSEGILKSSFSMSHLASVILKIFELMPLDVYCSHYGLFTKLTSTFLQLYFTELHHGIDHWSAVLKCNYNDRVKFIDSYCCSITTTANLLHYIIECINLTYDMSRCISHSDEISTRTNFASVSFLIPSFQFLVQDVYFFINLLKKFFAQNQPNVLNHVKKSIRISLEVLKFANHWLTYLTGTKPPSKKLIPGIDQYMQGNQLKASQAFEHCYLELKSQIKYTEPFNLFTATDGITDSELSDVCLCILCHKLSQYNINGAITFAHSFIFNIQAEGITSSISLSEDRPQFGEDTNYSDVCVNSCCGLAVIQCIAKLMCCYFTNRPLHIPSLSSIGCTTSDKHIELDRSKLAKALTQQDLQLLWSPEHALKLLLLSGLWEEAIQFPLQLGDWKKSLLLSVAFQETQDCRRMCFHTNTGKDFQFSLLLTHISNLLKCYKGITQMISDESQAAKNRRPSSVISMTQSEKGSPRGDMMVEVGSLLHIAAMCDVDRVLLQLCYNCLDDLTNAIHQLDVFVSYGVHLPSPPLYCPQPSVDQSVVMLNPKEWSLRQVMYEKVQQLLFLLRASHSLVPCIKCYSLGVSSLTEFIQQGGECFNNIPSRSDSNVSISTIMQSIMNRAEMGFDLFQQPDQGDSGCPHTAKVLLAIFRQLCGLLWYLHVRENATIHFRKLQSLANDCQEYDSSVADNAIAWCARLLPFVKFIDREDTKGDDIENTVLSLLLELPMDSHFVRLFAHCFPLATQYASEEKSDKWKSLMSRVKLKLDLYNAKQDEVKSPAELYTEKSKVRLEQLNSSTFQLSPFESTISQVTSGSLELTADALYVGSCEFEYDIVYVEFLDTLLSILSPIEETTGSRLNYSVTSLSKDHALSYRPPLIAAYYSQRLRAKSYDSDDVAWSSVVAFIEQIHRWAHLSSTLPSTPTELPSMRVHVHLKFLMNCLQLYSRPAGKDGQNVSVEYHKSSTAAEVTQSNGEDGIVPPADVPDFHEDSSSSTTSADNRELMVEHLTNKTTNGSVELMDHSKESIVSSNLLLQLPQGTLQGQLSQYEVSSLHKSVSSYLHDSSHTSVKQSTIRHHTGPVLNEEFSVGEHISSACSDNVFSTSDELSSTTSNTLSLSTGEVAPNKKEFTQQETTSIHNLSNHTSPMNKELNNEVDNKVMDNGKLASDSDHSDSSSSNNTTLIAEDSTETVQVQPMESLIVSDTQPQQPMVTSGKENVQDDSLRSVSDQSTLSQSCEKISETVTHSITQLKTIDSAEQVVMKQLEQKQPDHTMMTGSHNDQHDPATTATLQHSEHDTSTDNDGGYMEKDSLCTSQQSSSVTSAGQLVQDNMLISRSQLRKVLKAEIRKLLPPLQDHSKNKPDSFEVSVQYEAPNSDSVKSTSVKDSSSPVEATVERHVYQEISSTENTPSLLEVKDLEESPDGVAVDKTHITVVVADDTPGHYDVKRDSKVQKQKSNKHRKLRKPAQIVDKTLSNDNLPPSTISSINSSQSVSSDDVVQDTDLKHIQERNVHSSQCKNIPLLQFTSVNGWNQDDDMKRQFPGLVKSLQIFDDAVQHKNPFAPQSHEPQHPAPKTEYGAIPSHNQVPPNFEFMPYPVIPAVTHKPSNKIQGQQNTPQFPAAFPLLNVSKNVAQSDSQSDFHFPLIPFKPFVPKLIKPNDMSGRNKESKLFPLLHFEHPSYQQAKQLHPLLKLPEKEFPISNETSKPIIPLSKHHHELSSQSSVDSMPYAKEESIPSSTSSTKTKQHHRRIKKSKPSRKSKFVDSSVQTDAPVRASPPVIDIVKSSRLAETSSIRSPMSITAMMSPPVLTQHQGLEMKRIEIRQSKITPPTVSALQQTATLDNINDNNIQTTSDIVPSTADTVSSGSCVEVTHTKVVPDHHHIITDQDDRSSNKYTSTAVTTDQDDQDDKSSNEHTSTIVSTTDQDDKTSIKIDADQEETSSHKQSFINVTDIEGELVVSDDHKETASDTSVQSSVQGIALLMEHNSQNVTEDDKLMTHSTANTSGIHSGMLTKLQEMDAQLTAIENTAKKVEGEFQDSNQLLDTINQLQQVKALQDRKSAPNTSAEPVAPQTTATVIELLTKPSPNHSSTPDKLPSLQSSSTDHLTDEMVNAASGSSDDNMMSGTDPTGTLVEMNVEQVSNVIPSTADNLKSYITPHPVNGRVSGLLPEVRKHTTRRRQLSSTRQSLSSTVTLNQAQRRKQEKSNNDKRLRDAFSLMNDILTSKPSVDHKPSYKQANHDGSTIYKRRRLSKVDTRSHDSMDTSIASGSVDWDAVDQILNS